MSTVSMSEVSTRGPRGAPFGGAAAGDGGGCTNSEGDGAP